MTEVRDTDPRWIDTDAELATFIAEVAREPAYGLDTESMSERTYWTRLCVVQVSWPGGVALIDPLACDVTPLGELLRGRGTMVTHAGASDLPLLERACGARPTRLFDTQVAAGFLGLGTPSLASLVSSVLGIRLDKSGQLTDWARRPLPEAPARYAAGDVVHLLPLQAELRRRLVERGREEWAEAEFEVLRTAPTRVQDPDTAWWRIKGASSLRGERAGVAQAVAAWRERRAQERDVPARFVLGDLGLSSIVDRPPTTAEELARRRGVGTLPPPVAKEILAAIEAGRALTRSDLVVPPARADDPAREAAVGLLAAWTADVAAAEGIAPRLLATKDDVRALVNGRPSRLDHGWRAELVGDRLHELLAGRAVLRLVDGGRRVQLEPVS